MKNAILWAWIFVAGVSGGVSFAEEGPVARVSESGDAIEMGQQADGKTLPHRLPLYRAGAVRYFSAGVGLEERAAHYPSFPLKLVFTAGGKPFLAGVAVAIQPVQGGAAVAIPGEQVDGPWLFVDLAPGLYDVTALHGGVTQVLKGVRVEAGKQRTVYVRWTEDRGLGRPLPGE